MFILGSGTVRTSEASQLSAIPKVADNHHQLASIEEIEQGNIALPQQEVPSGDASHQEQGSEPKEDELLPLLAMVLLLLTGLSWFMEGRGLGSSPKERKTSSYLQPDVERYRRRGELYNPEDDANL